jgi:hypothetical protein
MVSRTVTERIRLLVDLPEQQLERGEVGVVCSCWFAPQRMFEVEFVCRITGDATRVLLSDEQFEVETEPADRELASV